MNYIIDPVNYSVFDDADPQTRKIIVLLGINTYENIPRSELVFRDQHIETRVKQLHKTIEQLEHELSFVRENCMVQAKHDNEIRLKQKEYTINHLEEELRSVRETQAANLKHELILRETETTSRVKQLQDVIEKLDQENKSMREKHMQELDNQLNNMIKRFEVEYNHIESLNVKLNTDIQRLIDERDKHVEYQVERTTDVYKQQLQQEKEKMEIQQRFNSRLQAEIDNFKVRKMNSAVSVGSIAENEVEVYLGNMFNEGKLTNMSKTAENADFHFEYNGVRLLIEVKNYTNTIPQKPAIDKFLRDIVSSKVDGGIIVSCVDGIRFSFRKSMLDWDFHQNIPTLYLTDFFSNPNILYGGVLAMIHYIRFKKEFERNNNQSAHEHKEMFLEILGEIETWVPLAEKATKYAKITWETVNELNHKIITRLSKYDISTSALKVNNQPTSLDEQEVMKNAWTCYEKLQYIPTAKELMEHTGITQLLINKVGGMKAIRKYIETNTKQGVL